MLKHAHPHLLTETSGTIPNNPQALLRKNSGVATHFKGILVSPLRGKRSRKKSVPLLNYLPCASVGWLPDGVYYQALHFLMPCSSQTQKQRKPKTTRKQNQKAHTEPANGAVFSTVLMKLKVYVQAKMSKPLK